MRPVVIAVLEATLGRHHFDLDRVFGMAQRDGSQLHAFPPDGYEPSRIGWDCFEDLLETKGCEAERVDPVAGTWALTYICPRHAAGSVE